MKKILFLAFWFLPLCFAQSGPVFPQEGIYKPNMHLLELQHALYLAQIKESPELRQHIKRYFDMQFNDEDFFYRMTAIDNARFHDAKAKDILETYQNDIHLEFKWGLYDVFTVIPIEKYVPKKWEKLLEKAPVLNTAYNLILKNLPECSANAFLDTFSALPQSRLNVLKELQRGERLVINANMAALIKQLELGILPSAPQIDFALSYLKEKTSKGDKKAEATLKLLDIDLDKKEDVATQAWENREKITEVLLEKILQKNLRSQKIEEQLMKEYSEGVQAKCAQHLQKQNRLYKAAIRGYQSQANTNKEIMENIQKNFELIEEYQNAIETNSQEKKNVLEDLDKKINLLHARYVPTKEEIESQELYKNLELGIQNFNSLISISVQLGVNPKVIRTASYISQASSIVAKAVELSEKATKKSTLEATQKALEALAKDATQETAKKIQASLSKTTTLSKWTDTMEWVGLGLASADFLLSLAGPSESRDIGTVRHDEIMQNLDILAKNQKNIIQNQHQMVDQIKTLLKEQDECLEDLKMHSKLLQENIVEGFRLVCNSLSRVEELVKKILQTKWKMEYKESYAPLWDFINTLEKLKENPFPKNASFLKRSPWVINNVLRAKKNLEKLLDTRLGIHPLLEQQYEEIEINQDGILKVKTQTKILKETLEQIEKQKVDYKKFLWIFSQPQYDFRHIMVQQGKEWNLCLDAFEIPKDQEDPIQKEYFTEMVNILKILELKTILDKMHIFLDFLERKEKGGHHFMTVEDMIGKLGKGERKNTTLQGYVFQKKLHEIFLLAIAQQRLLRGELSLLLSPESVYSLLQKPDSSFAKNHVIQLVYYHLPSYMTKTRTGLVEYQAIMKQAYLPKIQFMLRSLLEKGYTIREAEGHYMLVFPPLSQDPQKPKEPEIALLLPEYEDLVRGHAPNDVFYEVFLKYQHSLFHSLCKYEIFEKSLYSNMTPEDLYMVSQKTFLSHLNDEAQYQDKK